ncbi:MAG: serine hydrolase domain-containing protein [Terracidiphilus sp.]
MRIALRFVVPALLLLPILGVSQRGFSQPAHSQPARAVQPPPVPAPPAIDAQVRTLMARTHANGIAVAVVDHGRVRYLHAFGIRNAQGGPLTTHTVMYGASLTKTVFAYTVMRLVDRHTLSLDTPLRDDLDHPLPSYTDPAIRHKYAPYQDLAGDSRWRQITPRMCLTHATGFGNFWFLEPDHKLHIHFTPGSRFSYSGDGFVLLQFAIEHGRKAQGLGLDVGNLTNAMFGRLGMTRSSLVWRADFTANNAGGWDDHGKPYPHNRNSKVRAAGSMDTTISDMARFAAALVSGRGLSRASFAAMTGPQVHITTAHQFPILLPELPPSRQRKDLYAGLGVIVFNGPQGHGFYKGGHDSQTANTMVCLKASRRCVVILSNDVRAEAGFANLVHFILGSTGVPYDWEYGDYAGHS